MSQSQEELNAAGDEISRKHMAFVEDRVRRTAALHPGARVGTAGEAKVGDRVIEGWLPDSEGREYVIEELKKKPLAWGTPRDSISYKLVGIKRRSHCSSLDWMIYAS